MRKYEQPSSSRLQDLLRIVWVVKDQYKTYWPPERLAPELGDSREAVHSCRLWRYSDRLAARRTLLRSTITAYNELSTINYLLTNS